MVAGLNRTVGHFGHARVIAYFTFNVPAEKSDYDIALLIIYKPLGLAANRFCWLPWYIGRRGAFADLYYMQN